MRCHTRARGRSWRLSSRRSGRRPHTCTEIACVRACVRARALCVCPRPISFMMEWRERCESTAGGTCRECTFVDARSTPFRLESRPNTRTTHRTSCMAPCDSVHNGPGLWWLINRHLQNVTSFINNVLCKVPVKKQRRTVLAPTRPTALRSAVPGPPLLGLESSSGCHQSNLPFTSAARPRV